MKAFRTIVLLLMFFALLAGFVVTPAQAQEEPNKPDNSFTLNFNYSCPNDSAQFFITGILPPSYYLTLHAGPGVIPYTGNWVVTDALSHPSRRAVFAEMYNHTFQLSEFNIDKNTDEWMFMWMIWWDDGEIQGRTITVRYLCNFHELYIPALLNWH